MDALPLVPYIVIAITLLCALVLSFYHLLIFSKLGAKRTRQIDGRPSPVSIVICARNESENLKQFLPLILAQDHPDFEVIVVNDASYDGTEELLNSMEAEYPHLHVVRITEEQKRTAGKKMALTLGFKRASKDIFLLTDADCRPNSKHWISSMCDDFKEGIVIGYSGYEKHKGLLNLLIRFDTWTTAVHYLSAGLAGKAYMGVGRNMGYTRDHYHDNGGFKSHYHIMSGDDDLMVNYTSTAKNVTVRAQANAHTTSIPKKSWSRWFNQKRRHMSVSKVYTARSKRFIGIYHFAQVFFYAGLALLILLRYDWKWILSLFLLKTTIHLLISIRHSRLLKEKEMVVLLPLLEPVMLSINITLGLWSRMRKPKAWK
jgi:glycosyltransferase involved in cell wall biosynthesis